MLRALVGAAALAAAVATPAFAVDITGAGAGIKQIGAKTVDFGASDMPLKPEELDKAGLLQFPTVIGGDVPIVNLKEIAPGQLRLSGPLLAEIYLGRIRKWNDPAIAALNPGVGLPASDIN